MYIYSDGLTHPLPDKMVVIFADDIFECILLNGNYRIPIQIFTEICSHESNWQ